jgi:hypothetical protein
MKRFISIVSCLTVLLCGFIAALAACTQVSGISDDHRHPSISYSAHDHHSDASHDHSDGSVVHCPPFAWLISNAVFSAKPDLGSDRLVSPVVTKVTIRLDDSDGVYRIGRSPPVFAGTRGIPTHLFHSVLLI